MKKRIITISRECGSGGHSIGAAVAKKLSLPFYDKKLLEMVSKRSGLSEETIEEQGEYTSSQSIFSLATSIAYGYNLDSGNNMGLPDQIYAFQADVIRELAGKESCVIIGRCADYILKDREDSLHMFIYADMERKKERVINEHRVEPEMAEKHIHERDKKRSTHYEYYTARKWGQVSNFHVCLDSGKLGFDDCVDAIIYMYNK